MPESDLTSPVDEEHRISVMLLAEIRGDLIGLRQPGWEPAPMPTDYEPSASELFSLIDTERHVVRSLIGDFLHIPVTYLLYDYALR